MNSVVIVGLACIVACNAFFPGPGPASPMGFGGFGPEPLGPNFAPSAPFAPFPPAVGPTFNNAPNGYAQTYWNNHYYPYYPAGFATHALGKRSTQ